jgi:uncharacterized membrane protein YciS (DUF1049 family)
MTSVLYFSVGCIIGWLVTHVRWLAKTSDLRAELALMRRSLILTQRTTNYTPGM